MCSTSSSMLPMEASCRGSTMTETPPGRKTRNISAMPLLGFLLGTVTPLVGFVVAGLALRGIPHWRTFGSWLLVGSPLTLALMILSLATFSQDAVMAGHGVAGLTEGILTLQLAAWYVTLGWLAFGMP